jgi:hypothetical protein
VTESRVTQRALQLWIIAVLLIVSGVLLARLVRAALRPAVRLPETEMELHLVTSPPIAPGSVSPPHTRDPWKSPVLLVS